MIGTLPEWRSYALARGNDTPTEVDDTLANQALLRASDYIAYSYVACFVAPYTVDSPNVTNAVYEAANFELSKPGFFAATFTASQQKVLTEVKGIKWTAVGGASGAKSAAPTSTLIDAILAVYMPLEHSQAPYIKAIGGQK